MGIVVGIDASRNRSGGARVHLAGLLGADDPRGFGIDRVHVWSYRGLLDALPEADWLVRHCPQELQRSLPRQMWWQRFALPREAADAGCDILLNTDAGTVCRFRPSVAMSRDMLSYEPGEIDRYAYSRAWLRLLVLRHVQAASLRRADGAIFLTRYAAEVIQQFTGPLRRVAIIPHGVADDFRRGPAPRHAPSGGLKCLYVSPLDLYKHQWVVVRAFAELRRRGRDVKLILAGGTADSDAAARLEEELRISDPAGEFVRRIGFVERGDLPAVLGAADVFVFASSCENMPNTLVEGMASGLPIACSNRGPMPEVLRDGGVYFDPEDEASIVAAMEELLAEPGRRSALARRAFELAQEFSWQRCARETWTFLAETANAVAGRPATPLTRTG